MVSPLKSPGTGRPIDSQRVVEIFLALSNDPDAEHQILAVGKIIELAQRLSLKVRSLDDSIFIYTTCIQI